MGENALTNSNKKGKPKGAKNISPLEKICSYCGSRESPVFQRWEGEIYCNKHLLHLKRHGYIKEHTLKDKNTFQIDEERKCVFIDVRDIEGKVTEKCIVDLDDWDKVKKFKWSITKKKRNSLYFQQK